MNTSKHKTYAFTLIELLTVIAIIAILGGILIPIIGGVSENARIASSKARLAQYINALELFKAEYNYYPTVFDDDKADGNGNVTIGLATILNSENFVEALSGRDHLSGDPAAAEGNYKMISFYTFSEKEFLDEGGGDYSTNRLADMFNNTNIYIMVDFDGDGTIRPYSSDPVSPGVIKGTATAWVVAANGNPGYALWE